MSQKQISREKFLSNAELQKKLLNYSISASLAVAAGVAVCPGVARADGVVVDVDPDETVNNGAFFFDFDQDGNDEFWMIHTSSATTFGGNIYSNAAVVFLGWSTGTAPTGPDIGSSVMRSLVTTTTTGGGTSLLPYGFASALAFGAPISSGITNFGPATASLGQWYRTRTSGGATLFSTTLGPWDAQTDMYLGVKFDLAEGSTHYGWIELDVADQYGSFTVKRYGYNDVAGGSIPAAVMLANLQAASPVSLQALVAGAFAALGGALAWLRQRVVRRGRRV